MGIPKKKRLVCMLLALLLLMGLAACAGPKEALSDQPAPDGPEGSSSAPIPEVVPPQESAPVLPEPTVPEAPVPHILDGAVAVDGKGALRTVPNERVEQGQLQKLLAWEGGLLLWGSGLAADGTPALKLAHLSLKDGSVLAERALPGIEIPGVQICGDRIAVTDWADGEIILLDGALQTAGTYWSRTEYCGIYLDPAAERVWCFTQNDGLRMVHLDTGAEEILLADAALLVAGRHSGNIVTFSYTDRSTQLSRQGALDLATGQVELIPFDGAFHSVSCSGGIWLAGVMGQERTYWLGRESRPNAITMPEIGGTVSILSDPVRLLTQIHDREGWCSLQLYSLDGAFLSGCRLPWQGAGINGAPVWSGTDGGYYFVVTDSEGVDRLLFWNLAAPVVGRSLQLEAAYTGTVEPGTVVSGALYDRADVLSEAYGVQIHIAEKAETGYREFTALPELDETCIAAGLDALEAVLSAYPAGFLPQLLYGSQRGIEFHLTGDLTKTTLPEGEISGFTSFSGFADALEAKSIVVVDIARPGSLEQTLHHEIFHLIDNKLAFDANLRPEALYSEAAWSALNPDGFSYANDYNDLPVSFYNDGYETWFIDLYSRTFAREDRARILEYAMVGSDWSFSASPGRLAKLEYLCRCIRDCFDTEGWPEHTVWEATLTRSGG